jgi:uncharacterized membrane protein (DUF373 family)
MMLVFLTDTIETMKLHVKFPNLFSAISVYIGTFIRIVINILLILICVALVFGVFKAGYDLFTSLGAPVEKLLPQLLVDTVFIVALVEISLLLIAYLKEGYVHVRYIVDTILIIMLNEFVVVWFDHPTIERMLGLSAIVAVLVLTRVLVIRVSPSSPVSIDTTP